MCQSAEDSYLVEIVMENGTEVLQTVPAVFDRTQFRYPISQCVRMAYSLAFNNFSFRAVRKCQLV